MGQGRRPIGASTITQQVAKNMLLGNNEVSLARKVREALLAMRIEETLPKQRILEIYLNEIYLGLQSYGVAAAAQAYFNKPLDQLTVAEAAFLGALPKAPNNYNPFRFPDAARARRDWVIDRMAEDHAITADQARDAKAMPIVPAPFHRPELAAGTDWFSEEARRQLIDQFGADTTTQGGLVVRTSLNPTLQATADRVLREGLMAYDRSHGGWRGPVSHIDPPAAMPASGWPTSAWAAALAQVARPGGMLPGWQLAIVTSETDVEAKLGWLQTDPNGGAAQANFGVMRLADLGWARPLVNGPARRRATSHGRRGAARRRGDGGVRCRHTRRGKDASPAGSSRAAPDSARAGRHRVAGSRERACIGNFRRLELRDQPVRPGYAGAAAAGQQFQADGLPDRVGTWHIAQPAIPRRTVRAESRCRRDLAARQLRGHVQRPDIAARGPGAVAQPGHHPRRRCSWHGCCGADCEGVPRRRRDAAGAAGGPRRSRHHRAAAGWRVCVARSVRAGVLPSFIDSVQDRDGHVIWRAPGLACQACSDATQMPVLLDQRHQIADPQSVFQLITMMQGVVTRGTGTAAAAGLGRVIAGKTGTTQDFNDAWFVGFTPDLVTAVWVGFDQPQGLGENETGGAIAAPIWHDFMAVALKDRPKLTFPMPDGLTMASWQSGGGTVTDAFKPGQEPGASVGIASADNGSTSPGGGTTASSGLDSGLGGLY